MSTPAILIGLNGRFRSGKDAFYYAVRDMSLFDTQHRAIRRLAFGDAIRSELAAVCGTTVSEIQRDKDRFRGGLQWWAEFRRRQNPDYWIRPVQSGLEQLAQQRPTPAAIIITDVRELREAEFIRNQNGVLVQIVRPVRLAERWRRWRNDPLRSLRAHRTERELDQFSFDHVIQNDGSLEEFRKKVRRMWETIQTEAN
jgi:dephospho-CoA kinase